MKKTATARNWGKVWLIALELFFGNLALVAGYLYLVHYPIAGPMALRGDYLNVDAAYAGGQVCDAKDWGDRYSLAVVEKADGSHEFFSLEKALYFNRYRRANRQAVPNDLPYTCRAELGGTALTVTIDEDYFLHLPDSAVFSPGPLLSLESVAILMLLVLIAAECGIYVLVKTFLRRRKADSPRPN